MKIIFGFISMIICTVAANLMLKLGATKLESQALLFGWLSIKSLFGFALFGVAGLLYAWLLQWLPLNVAQSFAAAQFVAVMLASSFVLLEPISLTRFVGIALIAAGIMVVAWSS